MTEDELTEMIDKHWEYVKGVLLAHNPSLNTREAEYHYKSAARHFWKHAKEDNEEEGEKP